MLALRLVGNLIGLHAKCECIIIANVFIRTYNAPAGVLLSFAVNPFPVVSNLLFDRLE